MSDRDRVVSRVLVMLEYGPGDKDNGEVFDLTELVKQCRTNGEGLYSVQIILGVEAHEDYSGPDKLTVNWKAWMFPSTGVSGIISSGHLDDAINAAMPDGMRVQDLRKKAKRIRKKADEIERAACVAKLEQVAALRAQYPIARVTPGGVAIAATAADGMARATDGTNGEVVK